MMSCRESSSRGSGLLVTCQVLGGRHHDTPRRTDILGDEARVLKRPNSNRGVDPFFDEVRHAITEEQLADDGGVLR